MAKKSEINFKQSVADYLEIMGQLKSGRFANVYLLHGEEPYFIDKVSSYISANAIAEEERDFNQEIVYGADMSAGGVIELARTYPMMAERRVVVVREATQIADISKMDSYFDAIAKTTILVICHKGKSVDKRTPFYKKAAAAKGDVVVLESVPARDYEIKSFLDEVLQSHGYTIDMKAKEVLVEHLGCDLQKIDNEITKLTSALDTATKKITTLHIEKYVGISKDYNVFELTAALSVGDATRALAIVDYFGSNPKASPPVVTIPLLFKYFLALFVVGMTLIEHKKRSISPPTNADLLKRAKLPGLFLVDKYIAATKIYPPARAFNILSLLRRYDMKSKGMDAGSVSDAELMRELVLKIIYS